MREAMRKDRPKPRSNEAQCPLCWRLFTSDTSCEMHKPYRMPKTAECKDPAAVGLSAIDRRGLTFWSNIGEKLESDEFVIEGLAS